LALLSPDRFKGVYLGLVNRVRAMRVRYRRGQEPKDRNFVLAPIDEASAAPLTQSTGDATDDALLALANQAAAGGDAAMTAGGGEGFFDRWKAKLSDAYREKQLDLLLKTLRALRGSSDRAFAVDVEQPKYLDAAIESASRGYDVIVYGHTHLAKRVSLAGKTNSKGTTIGRPAIYLNSGTWADLMAVPRTILADEVPLGDARAALSAFADDLANNRLEKWRRQLPTFVRVDVGDDGQVLEAALQMLGERDEPLAVTTELMASRLG